MKLCAKIKYYFRNKIWDNFDNNSKITKIEKKIFRVIYISINEYKKNHIHTHVTSLTLYTLLSIVPVIAITFAIMKGFGLEDILEKSLSKNFASQEDVMNYVLDFSLNLLKTTRGGLVAIISLFFLFFVVIRLMKQIDKSFNIIWKIGIDRYWIRRILDYLAIFLGAILILVVTSSLNVFIRSVLKSQNASYEIIHYISPALSFILKLSPYFLLWFLFVFVFIFLPKEKVKFSSAFIAGIFAGSVYQLIQWGFVTLQIGVVRNNAIYGSFAALPLFIIWVQISWTIVLFSAEISFAIQNIYKYKNILISSKISNSQKKWIAVVILKQILKAFNSEQQKISVSEIANNTDIANELIQQIANNLFKVGLLQNVVSDDENNNVYVPSMPIERYTFGLVFEKIDYLNYNPTITNSKNEKKYSDFIKNIKKEGALELNIIDAII